MEEPGAETPSSGDGGHVPESPGSHSNYGEFYW
jgi:hypothetical protein